MENHAQPQKSIFENREFLKATLKHVAGELISISEDITTADVESIEL